jgi:outer membrane protein assembly factor BamB
MKLTKESIILAIALVPLLLTACTAQISGGFPAGAVVNQDILYISSGVAVLAVKSDGSQIWRYPDKVDTSKSFFAAPVVINGQVVVGDYQNSIFSLDAASGVEKWSFKDAKGRYIASPVIVGDKIIAANADGNVYALDQIGNKLWKFTAKAGLWATPAFDAGHVYVPSMDHFLYSINASDGSLAWATDLGGPMVGAPFLSKDGILYVGTLANKITAVEASSGKELWHFPTVGSVWAMPVYNDGMIYVGDASNKIYALNAKDGTQVWQTDAAGPVIASAGVLPTGLVFVGDTGDVFVVGFQNERAWTDKIINGKLYSTPIVYGDRLVVPVYQGDNFLVTYDFTGRKGWTFAVPK